MRLPAQDAIEYGMLLAVLAVLVLIGGNRFGSLLEAWLEQLIGSVVH